MCIRDRKDPFGKFEDINIQKTIPKNIIKDIKRKKEIIENGINRIEEASKIRYPEYYIEPILPIAFTALERGSPTPYFARNIFHIWKGEVRIIIQLSAPLIAFGFWHCKVYVIAAVPPDVVTPRSENIILCVECLQ